MQEAQAITLLAETMQYCNLNEYNKSLVFWLKFPMTNAIHFAHKSKHIPAQNFQLQFI